jgi:hypothetical protein
VAVRPRESSAAACSRCHLPAPGYDQLAERRFKQNPRKRSGQRSLGHGKTKLEHRMTSGSSPSPTAAGSSDSITSPNALFPKALAAAAPPPKEAIKQSICLAAKAYGVGTAPPSRLALFSSIAVGGAHEFPDPRPVLPKGSAEPARWRTGLLDLLAL